MKRVAVMTSGGDAPGMNAAIRAVVRTGLEYGIEVLGVRQAFSGCLNGDFQLLGSNEVSGILQRGGTLLQTARDDEFRTLAGQHKALRRLNEAGIEGMVVIGGDGSMAGAQALHKHGFPVVGVPGSIDNDIRGTDMCIGVDTALNTIIEALDRIRDTATSHQRAFLVEVMGRDSGYLALMSSILGGAEIVVTPERETRMEEVADSLIDSYTRGKSHAIAVIAEGASVSTTRLAEYLESHPHVGFEIRLSILGHMQRGGRPSAFDRRLASMLGMRALEALRAGQSGVMLGLQGREIQAVPLGEVIGKQRQMSDWHYDLARILSR